MPRTGKKTPKSNTQRDVFYRPILGVSSPSAGQVPSIAEEIREKCNLSHKPLVRCSIQVSIRGNRRQTCNSVQCSGDSEDALPCNGAPIVDSEYIRGACYSSKPMRQAKVKGSKFFSDRFSAPDRIGSLQEGLHARGNRVSLLQV